MPDQRRGRAERCIVSVVGRPRPGFVQGATDERSARR